MKRRFHLLFLCVALLSALSLAPGARAETMPFQTLGAGGEGSFSAVTGQPYSFAFLVFHPDPNAVVTSAQVIVTRETWDDTLHHEYVASIPITGIDRYLIQTDWVTPKVSTFDWTECTLPPGTYEWYVLVTVSGEVNTMYDTPELFVYPPVSVNDRASFTNDVDVTVTYTPRADWKYFQISNSVAVWPADWQPIQAVPQPIPWTLLPLSGGRDGSVQVYMRFAATPGGTATIWSDGICLDRTGPVTKAPSAAVVTRGGKARLTYGATDLLSQSGTFTIKIRNASGGVVRTLKCGTQYMKQLGIFAHTKAFTCTLPRGAYRFSVYATDLAGNVQSKVGSNRLVVK